MATVLHIIWFAVFSFCWFTTMRYAVQMFQQNSYRAERYRRWWNASYKWWSVRAFLLPCAFLSTLSRVLCVLCAFILFAIAYREYRKVYKVGIVWTKRVKRLFSTSALLCLTVYVAVRLTLGFLPATGAAILLIYLAMPLVLLANLVNRPLESAITRWYCKDAARILAGRPDLVVIGVTGSWGKTSTKNFLYRILSEKYNTLATPGNFNTTLGVVRTVREQLKPYHQVFIVEMGAKQPGDIREICDLVHPSIGIVTAVGRMHLETFGSMDNIQRTKFELIRALPEDGLGVINIDSEGIASYGDIPANCRIVRYGIASDRADVVASDITYSSRGTSFGFCGVQYSTHLLGGGNILDILAALVVADRLGVDASRRRIAVSKLQSVEHRLSVTDKGGVTILDDAYNSNPEGAAMALEVLGGFVTESSGRRIVVTPGMIELGDFQTEANREFGRRIAASADYAIIVNQSNREAVVQGLLEAGFPQERTVIADTLQDAVKALEGIVSAGDVVLYENDLPDMFR